MPSGIDPAVVKIRVSNEELARVQDNLCTSIQQLLDFANAEPFTPPKNIAVSDQQGRIVKKAKAGAIAATAAIISAGATVYGRSTFFGSKTDGTALAIVPGVSGTVFYVTNTTNTVATFSLNDSGASGQTGVSTANGFVSTATGFRRSYQMGTFWSNGTMPTADKQIQRTVSTTNTAYNVMNAAEPMAFSGSVISLTGYANASPGGTWTLTVYKNGVATTLTGASTTQTIIANAAKNTSGLTFVSGDILSVWIKGSSATMNQSFSASIEVESNA